MVDNHESPGDSEPYPQPGLKVACDVWRFRDNLGPPGRWAPALLYPDCSHILFADDDLIPGAEALAFFLDIAQELDGQFATLGVVGREFLLDRPAGQRYSGRFQPARTARPQPVHMTCRVQFVRARWLVHALQFRQALLDEFGLEALPLVSFHDDIQLCLGLQANTNQPSYLLPGESRPAQKAILKDLDDDQASWRRPGHFAQRNRLVDMALAVGWRPVARKS